MPYVLGGAALGKSRWMEDVFMQHITQLLRNPNGAGVRVSSESAW